MSQEKKSKGFVKGALVLMLFGFLSKIVGAIYRIPLTGIVGAEGMGLYQMVFPLYTLMLTISSSGLPSSISKLISQNIALNRHKQANRILKVSLVLLVCFSLVCTIFVIVSAPVIAKLQGNKNAIVCYYGLAPAILFVGLISGYRGYFQGSEKMLPSALSGFIEQIVKMACGLFLASIFTKKGISYGVLGAMLGISISEVIAFIYLYISYLVSKRKRSFTNSDLSVNSYKETAKQILSLSIFVTLGGLIMPLTMLIDSGLVINILKDIGFSTKMATTMFGLQTGTVGSIINMPVVLSLAVSTAILPCVSAEKAVGNLDAVKQSASKAVTMTTFIALPATFGCIAFAEPIIRLLYGGSLSGEEIHLASSLLEVASAGIFYLALVQVTSGLLQGLNKFFVPLVSLTAGGVVKTILNLVLIRIPEINILGAEVSSVSCYMVALFVNLCVLKKMGILKLDARIVIVLLVSVSILLSKYLFEWVIGLGLNYFVALFIIVFLVVVLYFTVLFILYRKDINISKFFKKGIKK